jgi:hypothetical protein
MSDDTWRSGCLIMDRRAAIYFTQLFISLIVICFCLYMLLNHPEDCNKESTYIGLLTLVIGVHLPNPKFSKNTISSPRSVPLPDPVIPTDSV